MSQKDSANLTNSHVSYQGDSDNLPPSLHLENKASGGDEKDISDESQKTESCPNRFGKCLSRFKLEILSVIFMFSWVLKEVSSTSMILDKVCLVHCNYSHEICDNLDNYTDIKSSVAKMATNYELGHNLIQTAPAVLISCFVGPWSDQYGRKIPLLIAIVGMALNTFGSAICAYFLYSRIEYYYIPAIFTGCFGGVVTVLTVIYSYASDTTVEVGRTMKYAFLEMALGLSQPLGVGAGGWIYKFWGYPAVFLTSAAGLTVSFVLVALFLPETRGQANHDALKTKLKNLFTLKTLKEGFAAAVKQRPNQGRKQILLLIICMCFIVIATNSTGNVNYIFAHLVYNWDNTTFSTSRAVYSVIGVVVLVIVVPILKYFKSGDPVLGLIGTISILLKYVGIGLALKPAVYHIANILGSLSGCASLAGRSRISKVVSDEDIGKVFSFVATSEALLPILTTVLISQIFTASLEIYPAMPYIVLALCLILPLGVFGWMTRLPNASSAYNESDDDTAPANTDA
ncbi:proton-coupled folate transporter-like [Argiope bruennichi]|uniref:Proton-coupled folate transporter like protein n=1 Tax=Argiope bruennichi TaxID=94029 RepID=A0A8T0E4P2_ARGBR|nr:proton-coupled folate transporter-like [Argiope bruennichi]XP_055938723.1 proton-coupled folate transporter-like [Argiope bruennichi]XP_055938733.1 proton-coupled folate transporter-like [Argiope bruennichi]XP_055938741.1 proton-coupled folate transporter-like [Argiope bruennichi]XP_055938750.1 proton-coupled folate transporter-like [Argiope bruennichi]XP_055938760.1 proton-coupled folate transporter-like [Argiope bruennichi]KAF8764214.1 Proton-coupled folate transporter like protein [Argi